MMKTPQTFEVVLGDLNYLMFVTTVINRETKEEHFAIVFGRFINGGADIYVNNRERFDMKKHLSYCGRIIFKDAVSAAALMKMVNMAFAKINEKEKNEDVPSETQFRTF